MSGLDQILGTLLTSLAHARRIADEETILIAEYYRSQPLLAGMSLPRIRVPELVVDLPLIIEEESPATPEELEKTDFIKKALSARLMTAAKTEGVKLPNSVKQLFERELNAAFRESGIGTGSHTREDVVRAVGRAFTVLSEAELSERLGESELQAVSQAILNEAAAVAVRKERSPATVKVSVRTEDIKEKSDVSSVIRIKLALREEGVELTTVKDDEGNVRRFLTPE